MSQDSTPTDSSTDDGTTPDGTGAEGEAGTSAAAEADQLQGYGNDTGFAAEAQEADPNAPQGPDDTPA